jgi:hypothetical protein
VRVWADALQFERLEAVDIERRDIMWHRLRLEAVTQAAKRQLQIFESELPVFEKKT